MRVTRPNLLCWFDAQSDPDRLPTFYSDCRTGALITYPGEETRFYMNLIEPTEGLHIDFPVDPLAYLVEYRSGGVSTLVADTISHDLIGDGLSCLYGSIVTPSVPHGLYYWKITWGDGNTWTSNLIEVLSEADARACSIRLEFRHSKTLYGVRYPWIDEDFSCALRVRANFIPSPPLVEGSSYREGTTSITRNYNTSADKILKFQTGFADIDMLDGLEFMLLHDTITLNNRPVTTKEHVGFSPGRGNLMPGTFSVVDNSFAYPLIP